MKEIVQILKWHRIINYVLILLTKSSKSNKKKKKTGQEEIQNHKSSIKGNKQPLNLEAEPVDFLHFYQIIHRTEKVEIHYFI